MRGRKRQVFIGERQTIGYWKERKKREINKGWAPPGSGEIRLKSERAYFRLERYSDLIGQYSGLRKLITIIVFLPSLADSKSIPLLPGLVLSHFELVPLW